jgi:hypothetical protein
MARRRNIFSVEIDPTTKLSETSVGATVSESTDEGLSMYVYQGRRRCEGNH